MKIAIHRFYQKNLNKLYLFGIESREELLFNVNVNFYCCIDLLRNIIELFQTNHCILNPMIEIP